MLIDNSLLDGLLREAASNARLRTSLDMRTSGDDRSQRMLNALCQGTRVAVHRHPHSDESVVCLRGHMVEVLLDDAGRETGRMDLCPREGRHGCVVPRGVWHTVEVVEPSVIFEAKDGRYGEDGSETM